MPALDKSLPLTAEVKDYHAKIEKIIGRKPTSRRVPHLRRTLEELERKLAAGEEIRTYDSPVESRGVSLPNGLFAKVNAAVEAGYARSASALITSALELWNKKHKAWAVE